MTDNIITISTAIAYPNAKPHLGHALEFVHADTLARFYRLLEKDVMFTTGVDEHGTKIYKTAKEENLEPQVLVDRNVQYYLEMCELFNISYDRFFRTSDDMLKKGAQKLWMKLFEAGDIYKASYEGLYCYGCENYMVKKDLVNGKCTAHNREPELLKEENYFFKLSKYIPALKKHIKDDLRILGEFRKTEILNMLDDLGDVSFSRPKSVLPWGVVIPNDKDHVMYVWCDALANYLTGLDYADEGEVYKKYWPTSINIIGKDIMKFHAIFWPAMLMAAGLELPKELFVHGFITSEGKKMSKTLGNVVDPVEFAKEFGSDSLRYYLVSQVATQDDGDFSKDRFKDVYQAKLANNIGNLVSRVVAMVEKYFDGTVKANENNKYSIEFCKNIFDDYKNAFQNYDLKLASEKIDHLAEYANKFIDDNKPWELAKLENKTELSDVLFHLLEVIKIIIIMLSPIIPNKVEAMFVFLGINSKDINFLNMFEIQSSYHVKKGDAIFPRLEK